MRRDGAPIEKAWAGHTVKTGITYGAFFPGLVSQYEEYDALVQAHYSEAEWERAPYAFKVRAVAYARLKTLVELHGNDAAASAVERKNK